MQPVSQDRLVGSGPSESASLAEPPMLPEAPAIQYDAFISYSHAADGRLAPALRSGLQRFATPWRVFRLTNPVRSLRIFQDTASLSANPELWPTIERALMASDWFVLLASPDAAASPWVGKEVNFWCRHKSPKRLLIVQTDGEITWNGVINDFDWTKTDAIPETLSGAFREEPRWVDARFARTEKQVTLRDPRFRDLIAELAAPLRGIPKDDLIGEDIRQHRRLNFWRNTGVAFLTALLIVASVEAVIAMQQRNAARSAQAEAEQNFSHAVNTADTLVSEVARRLKPLAGIKGVSAESVREILAKAEESYEKLMAVRPYSPGLQDKRAVMLMAFADIYADLGKTKEQSERAQKALEIMQGLVRKDPGNATWQRDLAASHHEVGKALQDQGELVSAIDNQRSCQSRIERLSTKDLENKATRLLGVCYLNIGIILSTWGDLENALIAFRSSERVLNKVAKADPENEDVQYNLATAKLAIAIKLRDEGNLSSAYESSRSYQTIMEQLVDKDPDNSQWQVALASGYRINANILQAMNDFGNALAEYEQNLKIREALCSKDPSNQEWRSELATSQSLVGYVHFYKGDLDRALKFLQLSKTNMDILVRDNPKNSDWQSYLASTIVKVADVLRARREFDKSITEYRAAQALIERLIKADPGNIYWSRDLANVHIDIGSALQGNGDKTRAVDSYRSAQDILERLVAQNPNNALEREGLVATYLQISGLLYSQGNLSGALKAARTCQQIAESLVKREPSNSGWQNILMLCHKDVGIALKEQGDWPGALTAYRAALEIAENWANQEPENIKWQAELASDRQKIGDLLSNSK